MQASGGRPVDVVDRVDTVDTEGAVGAVGAPAVAISTELPLNCRGLDPWIAHGPYADPRGQNFSQ